MTTAAQIRLATLATLAAALCASSAGVLVRAVEAADGWTILFYRGGAFSLMVLALVFLRHGRATPAAFRAIGAPGLVVAGFLGVAFVAFLLALTKTSVGAAVFVLAAAPLVAAAMGALFLGERTSRATIVASVMGAAGVALAGGGGFASGGGEGVLWALLACVGYAGAIVGLRRGRDVDMLPAVALSGLVALAISAALADDPFAISRRDLALALALGIFQIGLQYVFIAFASRHLAAPRVALIMLIEIAMAPLWAWLFVGETPSTATLAGGALILAALLGEQLVMQRTARATPA